MSFWGYCKLLWLSSRLVEFDINLSSSCGCNKITVLKYKCMSKSSFPKKRQVIYKSPDFQTNFLLNMYRKSWQKLNHIFLRVFMRKRILVFFAFRPCRKRPPVWDIIRKYLLSRYYHVFSTNIKKIVYKGI